MANSKKPNQFCCITAWFSKQFTSILTCTTGSGKLLSLFQFFHLTINVLRALDLALKHKTHIDTVLYLREQYLETLGKSENNNKYRTLKESTIVDPEKVQQKIAAEQRRKLSQ